MIRAPRRLGLIFFPAYDWAISPTHPEREERLLYTQDQLREEGVFDIEGIEEHKPDLATEEDVMRVHFCFPDVAGVTTESHMVSAGGAIKAARLVLEGGVDKAFALVRPPGHHAMKSVIGNRGFCNINNEAIMVEYIRDNYGPMKIAIVDTDCHHGDGTQDIYWNDPNILYISIHQDGRTLYPGSGHLDEIGGPGAVGKTVNIPLPPETSEEGFLFALDEIVLPILRDFGPDLVINSAGQDNHYTDPITNMNFTAFGYAALNDRLNPHIAVLEGGYSIQGALPYVNLGIVLDMAGLDYSHVREPDYNPDAFRQDPRISGYIKRLRDAVLEQYFHPPSYNNLPPFGSYVVRRKEIYYDTIGVSEYQIESIMRCKSCPGVWTLESRSQLVPIALGIEIPLGACRSCQKEGLKLRDRAVKSGNYQVVQVIDRVKKEYYRA